MRQRMDKMIIPLLFIDTRKAWAIVITYKNVVTAYVWKHNMHNRNCLTKLHL